jgi:hypothetical protein
MSFWDEQYETSPDQLPELSPHNHPNITPLPSGKFRAYVTRHRTKIYLGTFDTLEQALEAQSPLNNNQPSLQRVKKKNAPLPNLINTFLTHHGEWEP